MKSTEMLEAEHHVIQKVAEACGVLAEEMENGANLPMGVLQSLVAFLSMYAGQYHHEKEKWLVSMLRVKGVSSGTWPIVTLDHENLKLASLVNELAIAVDAYSKGVAGTASTLETILHAIAEVYSDHIWKEDYVLLPMADKLLSETDQQVLGDTLRAIDVSRGEAARRTIRQLSQAIKACPECGSEPEKQSAA